MQITLINVTMQSSAGNTLVLELTWIPLDMNHPSKHHYRPRIPSHGKSAKMQEKLLRNDPGNMTKHLSCPPHSSDPNQV